MIRDGEVELGATAGLDQWNDRYRAGYIKALKDILDVDFDTSVFPEETTNVNSR